MVSVRKGRARRAYGVVCLVAIGVGVCVLAFEWRGARGAGVGSASTCPGGERLAARERVSRREGDDERGDAFFLLRAFDAMPPGTPLFPLDDREVEDAIESFEHAGLLRVPPAKLRGVLSSYRAAMSLVLEGMEKPRRVLPPEHATAPFLGAMGLLRRLFATQCVLARRHRGPCEVSSCLKAIAYIDASLARHAGRSCDSAGFYWLSSLVDLVRTLEDAGRLPEEARKTAVAVLAAVDCNELLRALLLHEREHYLAELSGARRPRGAAVEDYGVVVGGVLERMAAREWLRATEAAIEGSSRPPWEALPLVRRAHEKLTGAFEKVWPRQPGCIDYVWQFTVWGVWRGWAERDVAVSGLACELYRSAHGGRAPPRLETVAPEYLAAVPRDPYTGRDLNYKRKEEGFVVWSVGEDASADRAPGEGPERKSIVWDSSGN
jgi:hypothetical protein